jgi:siroheme synthase-like protein
VYPPANKAIHELAHPDPRVELFERAVMESDVAWAHLVIEDSGSRTVAEQLDGWCAAHHIPLNAMDKPDLCDCYYMSLLIREPLTITIGSGGDAPAISSLLRKYLDEKIGPGWSFGAQAFAEARQKLPSGQARIDLLRKTASDPRLLELICKNDEAGVRSFIEHELRSL